MKVGTILKKERKSKGLMQGYISDKLEITQAYASKIENCKKINFKFSLLVRWCAVLDVKVSDVIIQAENESK